MCFLHVHLVHAFLFLIYIFSLVACVVLGEGTHAGNWARARSYGSGTWSTFWIWATNGSVRPKLCIQVPFFLNSFIFFIYYLILSILAPFNVKYFNHEIITIYKMVKSSKCHQHYIKALMVYYLSKLTLDRVKNSMWRRIKYRDTS